MHSSFKLQGFSFSNSFELIEFSETISEDLSIFLKQWFNQNNFIEVNTSGSTGTPKKIQLKKEFMKNSAKTTGLFFNLPENTTALCCLSTNYIAGKMMIVRALTLGWHLDVVAATSNPLENIFKKYDFCAMVPIQVKASLWDLHLIKKLIIGGGVISNALYHTLQNVRTKCFATYGMTETITHIAIKPINNNNPYYTILDHVKINIDKRGCLVIDAPKVADDLVITNDMITIHNSNQFEWLGRYDNVINSGGLKLHPEQIENEISKIIDQRFFVSGVADEALGEKLILVVEGNKTIFDLSKVNLNKYQLPKEIYFIDQFIETDTKKIQRKRTLDLLII